MLFALGIEGRKILLALWNGLPAKLLLELCEFGFISFLDSIIDTAISVGSLSTATLINFLFKLIMLSFDLLMLVVAGSDLVLDSLDFLHEIIKLTLILNIKFIHLLLRLVLDCLSRCQRALGVAVVFSDILWHIFKLVEVTKLAFFIIHNDLLILLDSFHNWFSLSFKVVYHSVGIVTLYLIVKSLNEFLLFLFQINRFGAFWHTTWRIWTEAKEITEDIIYFCRFL